MDHVAGKLRAVVVAVVAALSGLVAGAVVVVLAAELLRALGISIGLTAAVVLSLVATQGIAFGSIALAYVRLRGLPSEFLPWRVPGRRELLWAGGGYILALAAATLGVALVVATGAQAAENRIGEVAIQNPEVLLALVPLSFLLIGPGEELLFRGVVQGTLRRAFGAVGAIGIASAIFAAVHVVALSGGAGARVVTIGVLFLPSLVFGTAYERTRNLVVPALIHGGYNATLFTLFYVSLTAAPGA